jgi:hypothetical protein
MAEYDKRKLYPADLKRMDEEALAPPESRTPFAKQQEQGIEEGDWFDYLPPNPARLIKEGAKGVVKAVAGQGGKASKTFLRNRKDMNESEKQKDFKEFGTKLEGLKEKLPPEKRFEINKDIENSSYQQVYNKLMKAEKPATPVKVADKYVSGPDVKGGTATYDTASSNASIVRKERLKALRQPFDRDIKFKINEE